MKGLIIGLGSIGSRHVRNLLALGLGDLEIVRRTCVGNEWGLPESNSLERSLEKAVDFAIVCTPTDRHFSDLRMLSGHNNVAVLCEKPLVQSYDELRTVLGLSWKEQPCRVAFNMRYHPIAAMTRTMLEGGSLGSVLSARFSVGQYLPDWRPGRNHLNDYSAHRSRGGGVSLDLIHEIDLAEWLIGPAFKTMSAVAARLGNVTVDSEDYARLCYETKTGGQVSVELDYLTRGKVRRFVIVCEEGTLLGDFVAGGLRYFDSGGTESMIWNDPHLDRNDMYKSLMTDFIGIAQGQQTEDQLPSFVDTGTTHRAAFSLRESLQT